MNIGNLQKKLIRKVFQYIKILKSEKINTFLSSFTYMPTYGLCTGYFNLKKIDNNDNKGSFIFAIKNFLSISLLSSLIMRGDALEKKKKYNFLFISWANEKDFSSKGEFVDRYFNISSKEKNILWLLIYMGERPPKKMDDNILLICKEKNFIKYNLFFLFKYVLKVTFVNKFHIQNIYHQLREETCFALRIDNFLKKILFTAEIRKIYLPYESQTFQNQIVATSKSFNKKIKIYGYDHSIDALAINNVHTQSSPDFLYVHSKAQTKIYKKFLKWPNKKIIFIPSLRFFRKDKKLLSQTIFLPYNIESKKLFKKNLIFFLNSFSGKKIKPFQVKIHPFQIKTKRHILFREEIINLLKSYNYIFSNKSQYTCSVFFGATSSVVEALEHGLNVFHIVVNPTFEAYSNKFWPSINTKTINKNIFKYSLKKRGNCITFGNQKRNTTMPTFFKKI